MSRTDRGVDDYFVFLASPIPSGSYGLNIYPDIPDIASQVEVSPGELQIFLRRHEPDIAVEKISGTEDLFVSAMTAEEVLELTSEASVRGQCKARARA